MTVGPTAWPGPLFVTTMTNVPPLPPCGTTPTLFTICRSASCGRLMGARAGATGEMVADDVVLDGCGRCATAVTEQSAARTIATTWRVSFISFIGVSFLRWPPIRTPFSDSGGVVKASGDTPQIERREWPVL